MAKKNGVNKSEAIRDLLRENPGIKAKEAIDILGKQGIDIASSLFYFTKGRIRGGKGRRKKQRSQVGTVMGSNVRSDIVGTIKKVKALAEEVGGLKKLQALIEALHV
jgi:hypothetical protein